MNRPLLEVQSLQVRYHGAAVAVRQVWLTAEAGSIVAVLGRNGAGKTTLLRAISGFLPGESAAVTSGHILIDGEPQEGRPPHEIAALGLVLVPETNKVFTTLSVEENLRATPSRRGGNRQAMRDLVSELFPQLMVLRHRKAGLLSGGERQMLAISRALLSDPRVLLVDELSLGISPRVVNELMASLLRIRDERGTTIVMVEQNALAALAVADFAYVLERGRVVLSGPAIELLAHGDIHRLYAGGEVNEGAEMLW